MTEHFQACHKKGRGRARKTVDMINAAIRILKEIQPATVRAVCYRLFVEKLLTSMDKANTNKVSRLLVQAREEGKLPWQWIVDDSRTGEKVRTWDDPQELFRECVNQYRRDYWSEQPAWVELWSEKGTVKGTLLSIIATYGIVFRVMHGYGSATVVNSVAKMTAGRTTPLTVLYVGDRDPSGMHMSEIDLPGRLGRYGGNVKIIRIAIDEQDTLATAGVPWFPASDKTGDGRHPWYVEKYGHRCWELDALSPVILRQRVEDAIVERLDLDAWNRSIEIEDAERDTLKAYLLGYPYSSGQATI